MNNKPNLLFLTKSLGIGGVEVVTVTLAKAFAERGYNVALFCFFMSDDNVLGMLPDNIPAFVGRGYKNSRENVEMLRRILAERDINIIINQWGLPFLPIRVINKARKGMKTKVISVYHNAPSFNGRIQKFNIALLGCENPLKRMVLSAARWAFRKVTACSMAYNYKHSDRCLVLSPSYIEDFKRFTGLRNVPRLGVQTNPMTADYGEYALDVRGKQKEIVYMGRLDFVQKRVYRVIDTWNYLENRFPDWRLTIVGDGEDRENLENHAKALGLERVSFEGFQKPVPYYKRASILLLTSDFEGFPLVLAECMSFGVVPFVYQSFSAVDDIIEDGKDGAVLPKSSIIGYDAEAMAEKMAAVMEDSCKRETMARAAMEKSKEYSVEKICAQWEETFLKVKR